MSSSNSQDLGTNTVDLENLFRVSIVPSYSLLTIVALALGLPSAPTQAPFRRFPGTAAVPEGKMAGAVLRRVGT